MDILYRDAKKPEKQLFHPDAIVNLIAEGLRRDFSTYTNVCISQSLDDAGIASRLFLNGQVTNFLKKYNPEKTNVGFLENEAFAKFSKVNQRLCGLDWDNIFPVVRDWRQARTERDRILVAARNTCYHILGDLNLPEWFDNVKHSGGSTRGVPYEIAHLGGKMRFPVTTTLAAKGYFSAYLNFDEQFEMAHSGERMFKIVEGSRFTTVDKDEKSRRLIAIEPTANMFLQQGLMAMMDARLKPFVNIMTAQIDHKQRAWISSITGECATVDFSSASDSIAIELVRWLLPPDWFKALMKVRSPKAELQDTWVDLNMISTMGNATTFPLETLIFYSLATAVVWIGLTSGRDGQLVDFSNSEIEKVSVFGDDCILPSTYVAQFMQLCTLLGMEVNESKSFYSNSFLFRESCGGDYYHGRDVRPYYIRAPRDVRKSDLVPWLNTIMNSLIRKYISYFGEFEYVYHISVIGTIARIFKEHNLLVSIVPSYFPDDSGLKTLDPRLLLNWFDGVKFTKLKIDQHGTVSFQFQRFKAVDDTVVFRCGSYFKEYGSLASEWHGPLYWAMLRAMARRNPEHSESTFPKEHNIQRLTDSAFLKGRGGYVVNNSKVHGGHFY